jgi:hypothetical protein
MNVTSHDASPVRCVENFDTSCYVPGEVSTDDIQDRLAIQIGGLHDQLPTSVGATTGEGLGRSFVQLERSAVSTKE